MSVEFPTTENADRPGIETTSQAHQEQPMAGALYPRAFCWGVRVFGSFSVIFLVGAFSFLRPGCLDLFLFFVSSIVYWKTCLSVWFAPVRAPDLVAGDAGHPVRGFPGQGDLLPRGVAGEVLHGGREVLRRVSSISALDFFRSMPDITPIILHSLIVFRPQTQL